MSECAHVTTLEFEFVYMCVLPASGTRNFRTRATLNNNSRSRLLYFPWRSLALALRHIILWINLDGPKCEISFLVPCSVSVCFILWTCGVATHRGFPSNLDTVSQTAPQPAILCVCNMCSTAPEARRRGNQGS